MWLRKVYMSKMLRFSAISGLVSYGIYTNRHRYLDCIPQVNANTSESLPAPFKYPISREFQFARDTTPLDLTLFQYQTCPFCCKVRAYLDYHGISYKIIEVNSVFRTQIKWSDYKKVPILVVNTTDKSKDNPEEKITWFKMGDSSVIISALESYLMMKGNAKLEDSVSFYPSYDTVDEYTGKPKIDFHNKYRIMYGHDVPKETAATRNKEAKWRQWVDATFVHVISPNIYRTLPEALDAFHHFSEAGQWNKHFSTPERFVVIYVGALVMWLVSKRLKKRYVLKDDVRQSLYDCSRVWTKELGDKDFMGGDEPDLSDLAIYGVLSSFENCQAFDDLMIANKKFNTWYNHVKLACSQNMGTQKLKNVTG